MKEREMRPPLQILEIEAPATIFIDAVATCIMGELFEKDDRLMLIGKMTEDSPLTRWVGPDVSKLSYTMRMAYIAHLVRVVSMRGMKWPGLM